MEIGKRYEVVVEKIIKTGAIVRFVGEDLPNGFIHISNIADTYIDDVRNFIEEGETYIARCIEGKARPEELSLKELCLFNKNMPSSTVVHSSTKGDSGSRNSGNTYRQNGYRNGGIQYNQNARNKYRQQARHKKEYEARPMNKSLDEMIQDANNELLAKMATKKRK